MTWRVRNPRVTTVWDQPKVLVGVFRDRSTDERFFSPVALDRQLSDEDVGKRLRIEYLGERVNEKSGRTFKDFALSDWTTDDGESAAGRGDVPF